MFSGSIYILFFSFSWVDSEKNETVNRLVLFCLFFVSFNLVKHHKWFAFFKFLNAKYLFLIFSRQSVYLFPRWYFFEAFWHFNRGGGFSRALIWRDFFFDTGIKNFGNTKITSPFSRALRYFGLLSCNWALRHVESIENQNVVIVFGQSNNVAFRGNLQATAPRNFHLKAKKGKYNYLVNLLLEHWYAKMKD